MLLVETVEKDDFLSCRIAREEGFLHLVGIIFDHCIGSFDDDLRRSVVLFEVDYFGIRIVTLEVQYIRYICTTPGVYPLPVVTDDTEIFRVTREYTDRLVLQRIGILVLIYHEVLEAIMEVFANFRDIEDLPETEEKIIEIQSIFFFHLATIGLVDLEDDRGEVAIYCRRVFTRAHALVLCSRYHSEHAARVEFFFVDVLGFHDFFHGPEAVICIIYDEVFSIADPIDEHPEEKRCDRVKCPDRRKTWYTKRIGRAHIYAESFCYTFSHFSGCLVRKCDTKNTSRIYPKVVDHMDDTLRDCMRLS